MPTRKPRWIECATHHIIAERHKPGYRSKTSTERHIPFSVPGMSPSAAFVKARVLPSNRHGILSRVCNAFTVYVVFSYGYGRCGKPNCPSESATGTTVECEPCQPQIMRTWSCPSNSTQDIFRSPTVGSATQAYMLISRPPIPARTVGLGKRKGR